MLSLRIASDGGTVEAISLAGSITWSGDYKQCARTLKFTLAASEYSVSIRADAAGGSDGAGKYLDAKSGLCPPPGAAVTFSDGGRPLFDGFVVSRQKNTSQNLITVTCYDRGFYLAHNQTVKQYTGQTPESIARGLCGE